MLNGILSFILIWAFIDLIILLGAAIMVDLIKPIAPHWWRNNICDTCPYDGAYPQMA